MFLHQIAHTNKSEYLRRQRDVTRPCTTSPSLSSRRPARSPARYPRSPRSVGSVPLYARKRGSKSVRKFIEAIKEYPELWNTNVEGYRAVNLKEKLWVKVAKEHGFASVTEAKAQWKKLRDIHRDSLKRRRFKHMEPWKYSQQMAFLIPHMMNRKPENNVSLGLNQKLMEYQSDDEYNILSRDDVAMGQENCSSFMSEGDSAQAVDVDPIKKFFDSMCDSTKLLPEVYQLRIKKRVFEIVTEAEEHYIEAQGIQSDIVMTTDQSQDGFDESKVNIKQEQ
ncbi:hypothetical protein EVAR_97733_1 [Eumeta japonica]|uniref:MADF domain-containing protein n=1 Tax=Eumeta variegata TaxID=151549 RepID=A0A4C1X638_EUMVA|nr:hypothetical protein EVAR_97733_1 [Eumeta japonica]